MAAYGRTGAAADLLRARPGRSHASPATRASSRSCGTPRADVKIVLGDGRRTIAAGSRPTPLDLVIVDAFSSDSVPVHLLTREALELYVRKLGPGGLIAFHVSNRHLELAPVRRPRRRVRSGSRPSSATIAPREQTGTARRPVARDRALAGTARAAARETGLAHPEGFGRTRLDRRLLERPQRRQMERLTGKKHCN